MRFHLALKKGLKGNTVPGPDDILKRVWALVSGVLEEVLRQLFIIGGFPSVWRRAKLVIYKDGKDAEFLSAYRPICLLDEMRKLFERIIATCLVHHMSWTGPDLSGAQYGF